MPEIEAKLLDELITLSSSDYLAASVGDTQKLILPYPRPGTTADPAELSMARSFTELCMDKSIRDKAPGKTVMPDRVSKYFDDLSADAAIGRKLAKTAADISAKQPAGTSELVIKGLALTEYLKEQLTAATGVKSAELGPPSLVNAKKEYGRFQASSFQDLKVTKAICASLAQTRPELFSGAPATAEKVALVLEQVQAKDGEGWSLSRIADLVVELGKNPALQERVLKGLTGLNAAEIEDKADTKSRAAPDDPKKPAPERGRHHGT